LISLTFSASFLALTDEVVDTTASIGRVLLSA
jgi:hypothetical protein